MRSPRDEADVGARARKLTVRRDIRRLHRRRRYRFSWRPSHAGDGNVSRPHALALSGAQSQRDALERRGWSGGNGSFRGGCLVIESGRDVADTDDTDQAVIVDNGQMPDVVLVHEVTNMLQRIGRSAGDQLSHRYQLRNLQIDPGCTVFGDGADDSP